MKPFALALAGAMLLPLSPVQAAPMLAAPATDSLVHQADVRCAYLTEDGYCVRPHKTHKYWKHRHHYRPVYRTYEPQPPPDEYDWRYERQRPVIRVIPRYPQDDDNWDDWNN
ncbi:hypothetical protein [Mesorhizobium sp.]|uniref:hypothetical protein n=1 Tax=Mesorhizobium sp. TaxID=1871066 RepID=UPI0025F81F97|nr:hypothetical protein [Mesorhizobium sp.]